MNKADLVEQVAARTGQTKVTAAAVIEAAMAAVIDSVAAGEAVTLSGFGTFEPRHRKPVDFTEPSVRRRGRGLGLELGGAQAELDGDAGVEGLAGEPQLQRGLGRGCPGDHHGV